MDSPVVTVICLCFNQASFVEEAIESVLNQQYPNIQLIVVDDASTDRSVEVIRKIVREHPTIEFIALPENVGNCKAFNKGLALAKGAYVIDFAADDVLMPERITKQVAYFEKLGPRYGVVFTDATYIDENGTFVRNHVEYLVTKNLLSEVPQGDIFTQVISRYFIPSPTMMIRRSVLDDLWGYDEELSYEDFDFWVRSSRFCLYGFINERLTRIRKTKTSMSKGWYKIGDTQVHSTYLVCCKLVKMIRSEEEKKSLLTRIRYELRQCTFSHNRKEAFLFFELLKKLKGVRLVDTMTLLILRSGIPISWLRSAYHRIRYS
jgi:glycosyltransferase involved in cell wall biosynthesis